MLLPTRDHFPPLQTCCVIRLCCRLCPDDAMRDQQKGLKRLRKASATFSLGSPSEILLVGYPSGVHYTWPSQGSPQANRLLTVPTRVFCAEIRYSIPPSHRPDKIRVRPESPRQPGRPVSGPSVRLWLGLGVPTGATVSTRPAHSLPAHLGHPHQPRIQMLVSRSGQLDLDYRSVGLYVKCIMVSP